MTEIRSFDMRITPVGDSTEIAVAHWPGSSGPLVCVHGLTSHSHAFTGLATELPEHRIIAVDCRGRGRSGKTGPFGMEQHATDLAAVLDSEGIDRAVFVGHSMGAYVLGAFAARYPDRVERLVFIDGGYPMELPTGADPDELLDAALGVFLTKMRRSWTSIEEYLEFYENTPIYRYGVDEYGRAHFAYDLEGVPPRLRARVVEPAVTADWRAVIDASAVGSRLKQISAPLLLVRAPGGLNGVGDMVVNDQVRDAITAAVPEVHVVDIPGTNHHTILLSVVGARAVARAIEEFLR